MALKVPNFYSPNFDPKKRSKKSIKFIIIHYTGMIKESSAIKKLSNPSAKVSCHYFIEKKWANNKNGTRFICSVACGYL